MVRYSVRITGVDDILTRTILNEGIRKRVVTNALQGAGVFAVGRVQMRTPVRSGQTRSRIGLKMARSGRRQIATIGAKSRSARGFDILQGLEEGTGLFGPHKTPIVPVNAKVLRWIPRKPVSGTPIGQPIFRASVKGMKPRAMFSRTFKEDQTQIAEVFRRRLAQGIIEEGQRPG